MSICTVADNLPNKSTMAQPLPSWGSAMDAMQPVQERSDISFDSAELGRLLAGSDDEGDASMQPPPGPADAQVGDTVGRCEFTGQHP